jgi:CRISPR/Cas system-associated protein Csm6
MIYVKLARSVPNRASADLEELMTWARRPQMAQSQIQLRKLNQELQK